MEKHIANKQTEGRMDRWMGIVVSRKGMDVGKVGWIDEKAVLKDCSTLLKLHLSINKFC